jgi:hypothetical protein
MVNIGGGFKSFCIRSLQKAYVLVAQARKTSLSASNNSRSISTCIGSVNGSCTNTSVPGRNVIEALSLILSPRTGTRTRYFFLLIMFSLPYHDPMAPSHRRRV